MGDVVITRAPGKESRRERRIDSRRPARRRALAVRNRGAAAACHFVLFAALLASLAASGCRSTAGDVAEPRPAPTPTAGEPAAEEPSAAEESSTDEVQPARVTAVDVREAAPGAVIELTANEPLVWTTYRDLDGNVVVELPDTVAPGVGEPAASAPLVTSVDVTEDDSGTRPLIRIVVATREEAEHAVRAEGDRLLLELTPVEQAGAPELEFEPIAEEEAEPAAPPVLEPAPSLAEEEADEAGGAGEPELELGVAEAPIEGPAPDGVRATRLRNVRIERTDDVTVVEIAGDGQFEYSTFRLGEPERFVVDLQGVVNQADRSAVPVGSEAVERVRIAQFKPFPEPVSRVVFDLNRPPRPAIERTPESLIVRFSVDGGAAAQEPAPSPDPPEAAVTVTEEPAPEPGTGPAEPTESEPLPEQESEAAVEEEVPPEPAAERSQPSPPTEQVAVVEEAPAEEPAPAPVTLAEQADPEDLDREPAEQAQEIEVTNVGAEGGQQAGAPRIEVEEPPSAPSDAAVFDRGDLRIEPPREEEEADGEDPVFGTRTVSGEREYFGEPIDMTLKDADVVETLRSFSKISGLNIVIQPGVSGRVTVELHNVPWDQALEQILKINGLGYEVEGNIMRIASLDTLSQEAQQQQALESAKALSRPLQTVMKRLSYTSARNVSTILRGGGGRGMLSERGNVIVDGRTNTLIISELPEYMDTVLAIIDNLDEPEPQVMIEARIIETTKRFGRELGISWGFDLEAGPATGNSTGLEFPNNVDASGSVNLSSAGQNALLGISMGNILDTFRLDAVLNAAEEDGLVNILSTPKVATLNNHQAVIQSGVQVPIQTVANNTVTVQFVNATLRLEVTPQITADGTVVMDIRIQKREVQTAFLVPGATNAPIATKEAETQVLVRDGGTAVIGGIYEVSTDQSEQRVPGLANIPILGHLFRNRSRSDENEELLIFITPRVVRL